ncbi:MAG: phosphatase PAP2 family protein [Nanoarchaeota archaeon]|nr:phosphatase PAP2 family protein [Nanoarchaeota archaeon]MBU4452327.1 phosphatase PAP2 family protein [Nanoarchaeota archaeon]MCG2724549.1 phosphatase PAP2 family protein [archaeon]
MLLELPLTLYLNGYSPALLKAAYYVSESIYLMLFVSVLLALKNGGLKKGIYTTASLGIIFVVSTALKMIFNISRPNNDALVFIDKETDASFPSTHSSTSFGAAAISAKNIMYLWAAFIAVSRMVLGVHYLSDILAGAFIGYAIGNAARIYEKIIFNTFFSKEHIFETRRKLVHGLLGVPVSLFVFFAPRPFALYFSITLIIFLLLLSAMIRSGIYVPLLSEILAIFERKKDMQEFPLKGTIYFLIGSFATMLLFEKTIASAAIIILALGDCFSTLVGKPFGMTKHTHNGKKSVEGSFAGFVAAFIGALFLVSPKVALIGAFAGMFVESLDLKIFGIPVDDNFSVPIIAGAVMLLI